MYRIIFVSFLWGFAELSNGIVDSSTSHDSVRLMRSPVKLVPSEHRRYSAAVSLSVNDLGMSNASWSQHSTHVTGFKVNPLPPQLGAYTKWFSKFIPVFGFPVFAVPEIPDWMVEHAANVFAQYLDWDADGKINNPKVYEAMLQRRATLAIFSEDPSISFFWQEQTDRLHDVTLQKDSIPPWAKADKNIRTKKRKRKLTKVEGNDIPQSIYIMHVPLEPVILTMSSSLNRMSLRAQRDEEFFDESLEEIMHLIFGTGYAAAYPEIFSPQKNSRIAQCMVETIADCGFAFNNTFKYPNCHGHWHYNDETCDFGCLVSEYTFRSLTTILGGFDGSHNDVHKGACRDMNEEWPMCTIAELKKYEPHVIELYDLHGANPFGVPAVLPDGHYRPKAWPQMTLNPRFHSESSKYLPPSAELNAMAITAFIWFVLLTVVVLIIYLCVQLGSKGCPGRVRD